MACGLGLQQGQARALAASDHRPQALQGPVFTPLVCCRNPWAPLTRATGGLIPSSVTPIRLHGSAFQPSVACRSATAASLQAADGGPQRKPEQLLLTACRNALIGMAVAGFWAWLTSCFSFPGGHPLGSLTLAAPQASTTSVQAAVKSACTGLAAGVLHTLCGPDHLAALTPLTIGRNRVIASAMGALWGFGHSTGQLILGLVMVLLKDRFHDFLPALEKWSGLVVAATLVAIGCMGIYESYFEKEDDHHHHTEEEQNAIQLALATAGGPGATVRSTAASMKASFTTYATGIVYGLQPDALFVVVPALALPTKAAAFAYCTMFVIGTVLAMGGYTLVIGETSAALTKERPWLQAHLSTVASGIAILVGVLIGLSGLGIEVPFIGHFGHAH